MKKKPSKLNIKNVKCPVCKSINTTEIYSSDIDIKKLSFTYVKTSYSNKTFRALKCLECSHVFCSPLPKDMYKNYMDVIDEEYLNYIDSIRESSKIILPIIKSLVGKGKLLDIGCATGEFLEQAKKFGYEPEGLELSKWSSEIALGKGLKIHRKTIKNLTKVNSERYDVITLFGVIEHFEKPIEEMKYISRLLKPGGVLIIWTGDINSWPSKILGKSWWYWQGQHIQYFSERSLSLLANGNGIIHKETKTYPFVAMRNLLDNSLCRYRLRKPMMVLADIFFKFKKMWTLYIPGEMLWIGKKERSN